MNILICMYPFPFLRTQGQTLRVYYIAKHLARKHRLFLLGIYKDNLPKNSLIFKTEGIFEEVFEIKIKRKKFIEILNLFTPRYSTKLEFPIAKKKLYSLISQILKKHKIDILHVNGFPLLDLLLADFKGIPKVLDLCDSPYLFYKREIENTTQIIVKFIKFFKILLIKSIEKYLIKNYDAITLISHMDAFFSSKLAKGYFEIIPNGVDTEYFKPIFSIEEEFPSIIFFGAMSFKPNIDAVLFFHKEIFPKIKKIFPDIRFYIIGRDPVDEILNLKQDKNVIVTGTVDDIRPFILKANVVVVPMRMGSGMKNKILEAMALQKPIVCTSLAAESLDKECQKVLFIGDTPEEFANKTIMLLRNEKKRKEVGFKARKLVKKFYSWEKSAEKYCELYKKLMSKNFYIKNKTI